MLDVLVDIKITLNGWRISWRQYYANVNRWKLPNSVFKSRNSSRASVNPIINQINTDTMDNKINAHPSFLATDICDDWDLKKNHSGWKLLEKSHFYYIASEASNFLF